MADSLVFFSNVGDDTVPFLLRSLYNKINYPRSRFILEFKLSVLSKYSDSPEVIDMESYYVF